MSVFQSLIWFKFQIFESQLYFDVCLFIAKNDKVLVFQQHSDDVYDPDSKSLRLTRHSRVMPFAANSTDKKFTEMARQHCRTEEMPHEQ